MRIPVRAGVGAALGAVLALGAIGSAPALPTASTTAHAASASASVAAATAGAVTPASLVTPRAVTPSAVTIARTPTRIVLTPGPSTSTTQRISWTTRYKMSNERVQYRLASGWRISTVKGKKRAATSKKLSGSSAPRYTALLKGLKPGTKYSYRVVTPVGSTKWHTFKTGGPKGSSVTFIGLGDTQVDNRGVPKKTIKRALAAAPKAIAVLQAGDVVNNPTSGTQWADLFSAIGSSGRTRSWLVSIGNHEQCILITCNAGGAQAFRSYFAFPNNGYPKQAPTWFYTDYRGVRIVVLDSFGGRIPEQAAFLDRALATNKQKFSIVLMHAPLFASVKGRAYPSLKPLQEVIERRNVDLVLTGHDHSYVRGYRRANATVWVSSVSGPKYYDVSDSGWRANKAVRVVWAQATSTYQVITVSGNKLTYKAVVSHRGPSSTSPFGPGGVLDKFVIDKSRPGDKIVR